MYNGHMLKDEQNSKGPIKDMQYMPVSQQNNAFDSKSIMSYSKIGKLVTALYMVTDVMDKSEPLRTKLRGLGTDIISDINVSPILASQKISEILSLLDIASTVGMVSVMNSNILKKEFLQMKHSITENNKQSDPVWLEDFMGREDENLTKGENIIKDTNAFNGQSTRIGVQKGSTLMKVLSDRVSALSPKLEKLDNNNSINFDVLKKQRREEIIKIIKETGEATITDIRIKSKQSPSTNVLASCGEKTLQRELISMIKDNVLRKTGEKRWSKYFI